MATSNPPEGKQPRFFSAAKRLADKRGLSVQRVLDVDAEVVKASSYPSRDCLQPHQVELLLLGGEDAARTADTHRSHLANCEACGELLETAQPDPGELEEVLKQVRALATNAALNRKNLTA